VAVIDESLARKLFGRVDAAGEALVLSRRVDRAAMYLREPVIERVTVVGVVADAPNGRGQDDHNVYVPFLQQFDPNVSIVARGAGRDVGPLVASMQRVLRAADPDLAIGFAGPASLAMRSGPAVVLGAMTVVAFSLATIALVLSMAGLYGVLSHVVSRRTRELGLRIALGADRMRIVRLVLKDGFRPVAEGAAIGFGSAAFIRWWLAPQFSTVPIAAIDPVSIVLGIGPLVIAATIACYLPARRAASVDPNVALRDL
jgi:putative ABC transport system permease protein